MILKRNRVSVMFTPKMKPNKNNVDWAGLANSVKEVVNKQQPSKLDRILTGAKKITQTAADISTTLKSKKNSGVTYTPAPAPVAMSFNPMLIGAAIVAVVVVIYFARKK